VVGLLAAALGRPRGADLTDLAALRFGVRIDQPGEFLVDFHTVSGASHAPLDPKRQKLPTAGIGLLPVDKSTKVTRRHYLSDAVFVAGLAGDAEHIRSLADALKRPRYPLFLGRRSCPPSQPIFLGIRDDGELDDALYQAPWQANKPELWSNSVRLIIEDVQGEEFIADQPVPSPAFDRRFAIRAVREVAIPPNGHDPFAALSEG
jgi:CRISPR system Cascade subunit CasD